MTTPPIADPFAGMDPRIKAALLAVQQAKGVAQPPDPTPQANVPAEVAAPPPQMPPQIQPPQPPPTPPPAVPTGMQMQPPQNVVPPPTPSTTPDVSQKTGPGPIKSFLSNFLYGGGQAMLKHVGLQTDAEKAEEAQKNQFQSAQIQNMQDFHNQQQRLAQQQFGLKSDQQTAGDVDPATLKLFGLPEGTQLTPSEITAQLKQYAVNQGKANVATIASGGQVRVDPGFAQSIGMPELAGTMVSGKTQANLNKVAQGMGINHTVGDIGGGQVGVIDKSTGKVVKSLGTSGRIIAAGINANNRTVQVVDPNNPDNTVQMTPAQANAMGARGTQSVGFQTNKAITKDMISGTDGKNLNAFNTATAHLQQLSVAADALHNNNLQLFNHLGQQYAQATGDPAPTNFEAVKGAVAGEVSKVFKGGGATDAAIAEMNATINKAQSPAQLKGAIATYTALMNSKRNALYDQYIQGKQGTPNFTGEAAQGGGPVSTDGMISVQAPGMPVGQIHASQLAAFKAKYPNAVVK